MRRPLLHIDPEHNDAVRAEVGERLQFILRMTSQPKVPRHIRQLLDRLAERDRVVEMEASPSIAPSEKEDWLRRLLAGRFR